MGTRQAKIRNNLEIRSKITDSIRDFFKARQYLEIDVPCRIPAPLPEAHIDAVPSHGWYLQTSPESSMKRLLASGYEKIFTICHVFRQEERGDRHLPEFTMLEWYRTNADYQDLSTETGELVCWLAVDLKYGRTVLYPGVEINLARPWPRMRVAEAFSSAGADMAKSLANDSFDKTMAFEIEPRLPKARPVFLHDYPVEKAPLARPLDQDPGLAQRFELYMGGLEIANAFTELNDPVEQRRRFELENQARNSLGKPLYPAPEKFLEDLKEMPLAGGIALGLDRLVMLFANAPTVDEVTAFVPEEL